MENNDKTKEQLIDELEELRQRIIELERSKNERKRAVEALQESEEKYYLAEEALRESEEKYRKLIENIKEIIYALDKDGVVTYISRVVEAIIGYRPSYLIGRAFSDIIHAEDLPRVREDYQKILSGQSQTNEYRIVTRSGEIRWMNIFARPIFLGNSVVGMEGVLTDITERKHVEEALRRTEEQYHLLSNDAMVGVYIYHENRYLFVNRAMQEITGYSQDELLEMDPREIVLPADRLIIEKWTDAHRRGEKVPIEYMIQIKRKNGEIAYVLSRVNPNPIILGDKKAILGHCIDITKHKRAEMAKLEQEGKYQAVLQELPDIVYKIDPNGRFTFVNNSVRFLGYPPEELMGRHFSEIIHPDDVKSISRQFVLSEYEDKVTSEENTPKLFDERRTGKRQTKNLAVRLIPKSWGKTILGSTIVYGDVSSTGYYDSVVSGSSKTFLGTLGIVRDITERKLEEEIIKERAERYKTITENINVGVYRNTPGPKGEFIEANPAIVKMFGYDSKKEFLSVNVAGLYQNPEDRKLFNEKIQKYGDVTNEELELKKKDGTLFFGSVSAVAVKDELSRVKYYDGVIEDITETKQAITVLRESEQEYRLIFENAKDAIFWADLGTGAIIKCNKAAEFLLEKARDEIIGSHQTILHPPNKAQFYSGMFKRHIAQQGVTGEEAEVITKSGKIIPVHITASVTVVEDKPIIQGIFRDITERKRAEEELRKLAATDALTGVLNRGTGLLLFEKQLRMSKRNKTKLSVCYLDVNGLKEINDTYGHQEGDEALRIVCRFLKETLRDIDIISRLGGDEFLVVLPQCPMDENRRIWERIAGKVADFNARKLKPYSISLSCGFAEYDPTSDKSVDQLITIADKEMYKYKHAHPEN